MTSIRMREAWQWHALQTLGLVVLGAFVGGISVFARDLALAAVVIPIIVLFWTLTPFHVPFLGTMAIFFVNPSHLPHLFEAGEFTVRIVDVLIVLMLCRFVWGWLRGGRYAFVTPAVILPVAIFLGYVGLSLVQVARTAPSYLTVSIASFARLIETALFIVFAYAGLNSQQRLRVFFRFLLVAVLVGVVVAGWRALTVPELRAISPWIARPWGMLGANTTGLMCGLLILAGFTAMRPRRIAWAAVVIGFIGLLLVKSTSSIVATLATLSMLYVRGRHRSGRPYLLRPVLASMLLLLALASVWLLRAADVEGFAAMTGGSFAQRFYLANLGAKLFLREPLLGIGWQASSAPHIIRDAELNAALRGRFYDLPEDYFADATERPTSLHNMYVQLMVEMGIAGFLVSALVALRIFRYARQVIARSAPFPELAAAGWFFTSALILLLIWWNTNPLYPGQIESVLAMVCIGGIAAVGRLACENSLNDAHELLSRVPVARNP